MSSLSPVPPVMRAASPSMARSASRGERGCAIRAATPCGRERGGIVCVWGEGGGGRGEVVLYYSTHFQTGYLLERPQGQLSRQGQGAGDDVIRQGQPACPFACPCHCPCPCPRPRGRGSNHAVCHCPQQRCGAGRGTPELQGLWTQKGRGDGRVCVEDRRRVAGGEAVPGEG